ncbi:MAG: NAD(P)-binding domain-containing protein [Candidatus Latescibacterota bacterium]
MNRTMGFIGLGIMGLPMAKNLLKAGYRLVVQDVNSARVEELKQMGATAAETPKEVAAKTSWIITMLPDGPVVEEVALGVNGIIHAATSETVLIDMSSISPTVTRKVSSALAQKGARSLDAPVSGGEPGAISGQLVIMAGGPEDLFNEVKPVFDVLGKSAVLVGDTGAGQTTKLINMILIGIHLEAMGEAFVLAAKSGLDPEKVYGAIRGGLAGSAIMDMKFPMIMKRNFKPGFFVRLHNKDLKNALEAAESLGLTLPATKLVHDMTTSLVESGRGEDDNGIIIWGIEKMNNVEIKPI